MNSRWILLSLLGFFLLAPALRAEELDTVKARMEERLPTVNAMKQRKEIGEGNRGYLVILGVSTDAALVAAENADRKAVYESVAKATSATPEIVGQQRARQIAARSAPGIMLQDDRGNWYEKKG